MFLTFETEESYERATRYNDCVNPNSSENANNRPGVENLFDYTHYERILGEKIELQEASEPTDIIWENRQYTERERNIKRGISATIILIALVASGIIIFICQRTSTALKAKYPIVDCDNMRERFENTTEPTGEISQKDMAAWEDLAQKEYSYNRWLHVQDKDTNYQG